MGTSLKVGPAGGEWLQIDVPELGGGLVLMRRLDGRFDDLASRQVDYDFNTAGEYEGTELTSMVDAVTELTANAGGQHDPVVLKASWGQSVIVVGDEAAELLPQLRWAVALATRN